MQNICFSNGNFGYHVYDGDWNDMPTGIWETSSGDLNSPEGNDGHYYRVFCKANSFQQAYRIASSAESSLAYFRYCNNGTWRNWYKPYISNNDLASVGLPISKSVTDLYGMQNSGFFSYSSGANGNPDPNRGGLGICLYGNSNWKVLIVVPYNLMNIYMAMTIGSGWSNWHLLKPTEIQS